MSEKKIIVTAASCPPCQRFKEELKKTGKEGEYDVIDIETQAGREKIKEIQKTNPGALSNFTPSCVQEQDGTFSKCDMKRIWDKVEEDLK